MSSSEFPSMKNLDIHTKCGCLTSAESLYGQGLYMRWLFWKIVVELLSCVWLFLIPWTVACKAPLFMEFPRQEYWSGLPFPFQGDLPDPGIKPTSPALAGGFLVLSHQGIPFMKNSVRFPSSTTSWHIKCVTRLASRHNCLVFTSTQKCH